MWFEFVFSSHYMNVFNVLLCIPFYNKSAYHIILSTWGALCSVLQISKILSKYDWLHTLFSSGFVLVFILCGLASNWVLLRRQRSSKIPKSQHPIWNHRPQLQLWGSKGVPITSSSWSSQEIPGCSHRAKLLVILWYFGDKGIFIRLTQLISTNMKRISMATAQNVSKTCFMTLWQAPTTISPTPPTSWITNANVEFWLVHTPSRTLKDGNIKSPIRQPDS